MTLLVDTGASCSLIKHTALIPQDTFLDKQNIIQIRGINSSPIQTIGSTTLQMSLPNNFSIEHKMHVLNARKLDVPHDGILGNDFLKSHNAIIDMNDNVIRIGKNILPLNAKPKFSKTIKIPPRSNYIAKISISNNVEEGLIAQREIQEKVFIPNVLVKSSMNTAIVPIMNIDVVEKEIDIPTLELEEIIPIHDVRSINANLQPTDCSRIHTLHDNVRVDHLNEEERESILNVCERYNDIFHLPSDVLTTTKTLKHEIKTSSEVPVNSKTYRYPKVHEGEVKTQIQKMLNDGIIEPSHSPYSSPIWVVPKKLDSSGKNKWRLVIDYRNLNAITIGDSYPLPLIDDIIDQLGNSIYFSTLDLASGFHQMEMADNDKQKTAFSVPTGHYQFKRMPFGLKNAPSSFQRLMNIVLSGLQGSMCFVYLDDIVVYGSSLVEHNTKLEAVFEQLRKHNLKLQPDKCEFLHKEIAYLGHIISDQGVRPNPDKIEAITKIPVPRNQKDVKSFISLASYYRKFIPHFSQLSKPLTSLLKKECTTFNWTSQCDESFKRLKKALMTKPLLRYPDYSRTFVLTTDASRDAIGGVLSQDYDGHDLPICYYSRTLNKAEVNYSVIERELLAIVDACKKFRHYLYGRPFEIRTDHRPLVYLNNCKDPSSRLVRWRLKLHDYDYTIAYKKGVLNGNADSLSRIVYDQDNTQNEDKEHKILHTIEEEDLTFDKFKTFYQQELEIPTPKTTNAPLNKIKNLVIPLSTDMSSRNQYIDYITKNFPNNLPKSPQLKEIDCKRLPQQALYLAFIKQNIADSALYEDVYDTLYSLKLLLEINQVTSFVITDISYNNSIIQQATFFTLLHFLFSKFDYQILENERIQITDPILIKQILQDYHDSPIAGHPGFQRAYAKIKQFFYWENMKSDIREYIRACSVCQTSKTDFKSNKSPMEITTTSTKFGEQVAMDIVGPLPQTKNGNRFILTLQDDLTKLIDAYALPTHDATTVATYFLKYCTRYGFPQSVLSDQGTEFTSQTFKQVDKLLSIRHKLSSPYHPQTNGSLERTHLTLKDYFKCYVNKDLNNWDEFLNFAVYSYNTSIHKSTQKPPYELVFGQQAIIPNFLMHPRHKPTYSDLATDLTNKLKIIRETARENQNKAKEKSKIYYDKTHNRTYTFKENDLVLLRDVQAKAKHKTLQPNYKGPYKIVQIHDNQNATLQVTPTKLRTYHFNLLKPYIVPGHTQESDHQDANSPVNPSIYDPGPSTSGLQH